MDIQLPEVSGLEVTKWLKQGMNDLHVDSDHCRHPHLPMKGDEGAASARAGASPNIPSRSSVPKFIETSKDLSWRCVEGGELT